MILATNIKKDMVRLLGRMVYQEKAEVGWMRLSFEEKMEFAESVLDSAIIGIKSFKQAKIKQKQSIPSHLITFPNKE